MWRSAARQAAEAVAALRTWNPHEMHQISWHFLGQLPRHLRSQASFLPGQGPVANGQCPPPTHTSSSSGSYWPPSQSEGTTAGGWPTDEWFLGKCFGDQHSGGSGQLPSPVGQVLPSSLHWYQIKSKASLAWPLELAWIQTLQLPCSLCFWMYKSFAFE